MIWSVSSYEDSPTPNVFQIRDDAPNGVSISLPADCKFRVVVGDDGCVDGIEVVWLEHDAEGNLWQRDSDYTMRPQGPHVALTHEIGRKND